MFYPTISHVIALTLCIALIIKTGNGHSALKYFEQIHADDINRKITRREVLHQSQHGTNKIKEINFKTHGRHFRLILSPKQDMLHSNFKAYSVDKNGKESLLHLDYENFLSGRVFGEPNSFASLFIEDGLLTGFIHSLNETYYIEPSWRHSPEMNNRKMITYKSSDVNFNLKFHDDTNQKNNYLKDSPKIKNNIKRRKRQVNQTEVVFKKSRCSLLLEADYGFFMTMGYGNRMYTANYLIGLIDRVNHMFTKTVWEDTYTRRTFKNLGFVIQEIKIHEKKEPYTDGLFCDESKICNITKLLEFFSQDENHTNFCMTYLFTDRKFEYNVGGVAYVDSVCSPASKDGKKILYLNSAVSTSNYSNGEKILTRAAELIVSHELAHTWGARHDPHTDECLPNANNGGPYIMHKYSVTGSDVNNQKFSPCSRKSVGTFLTKKIEQCFTEIRSSFCGNHRVEDLEECDGGTQGLENKDPCCTVDCKLRENAVCSHLNYECCQNCQYTPANVTCREAYNATCQDRAVCTGYQANCPLSSPLPDKTECQERGKCYNGSCVPYCETLQKQSCMCDSMETTCLQCCRDHMNTTCKPIQPIHFLSDGTVCMRGMCYQRKCMKNVLDILEKFEKIVLCADISKTLKFFKDNIVGTVAVVTAVLWIFAGFRINAIDRINYRNLHY